MIRLVFSDETRERLRHERIHHPHPRVRQRLEALYPPRVRAGRIRRFARIWGSPMPTLIGYLRLYQEGGWVALTGCRFHRTQSALAPYEGLITTVFAQKPRGPSSPGQSTPVSPDLTGIERSPGAKWVRC